MRGPRTVAIAAILGAAFGLALAPRGRAQPVQEQRDRLPPPAQCPDAVAGRWLAHVYYPHVAQWARITLTIEHAPGSATALGGTIHAQWWTGDPAAATAPTLQQCTGEVRMFSVIQDARGELTGGQLRFEGTAVRPAEPSCPGEQPEYLLDRFSGTLDSARQELQAGLSADSAAWDRVPTLFRRVACADGTTVTPGPAPGPPAPVLQPPRLPMPSSGCNCGW